MGNRFFRRRGQAISSCRSREVARQLGQLPQSANPSGGITVGDLVGRGRYPHQRTRKQKGRSWPLSPRAAGVCREVRRHTLLSDPSTSGQQGGLPPMIGNRATALPVRLHTRDENHCCLMGGLAPVLTINVAVPLAVIVVVRLRRRSEARTRFDEKLSVVIVLALGD
jgi:hypothetical protein